MLAVGLWGWAKRNSYIGKGHRAGTSVYFGHVPRFLLLLLLLLFWVFLFCFLLVFYYFILFYRTDVVPF